MSYEAWPSPDSPRGPLPRIDDLPIAEQGYDQEAVREAFDAFYRHAAQLDASLKALEAVEVFRRDAMELRNDLRSLRSLGIGGGAEPSWASSAWTYERPRPELPAAVPRLAAEAALVIAVAVIAGVAHFKAWLIVALMAAAWLIVALSEWLAARARTRVPASFYEPLAVDEHLEPAPYVEAPAVGWSAFEPPEEAEPEADELTMVEQAPEPVDEEPEPAEAEAEPEAEAEADVKQSARRGLFGRRREEEPPPVEESVSEPPSHVRVLAAPEVDADPWERGFDGDDPEQAEPEPSGLGRIKRRRR
jgi:hypothetical protein